jgi:hypothetical protein
MFEELSLVVPTAGYPNLVRSLETYRKYAPGAKVVVVDQMPNGSLTKDQIKELTDAYLWVYRTLGFSKAVNMGIDVTTTEFVCIANDDVELISEDWFMPIVDRFVKMPDVGAINPSSVKGYRHESDHLPCNCGVPLDPQNDNCPQCRSYKEEYTDDDWDHLISKRVVKLNPMNPISPDKFCDGVMTWFTVFRRETLELIKDNGCYFDERFYPGGGEDYDLMCRMYDIKYTDNKLPYRAIGVFDSWAYHHWFGTRIKNPPPIVEGLRWNKLENVEGSKYGDNWSLWGRKDPEVPLPPCTKIPL